MEMEKVFKYIQENIYEIMVAAPIASLIAALIMIVLAGIVNAIL
jgi:hypothetical protein